MANFARLIMLLGVKLLVYRIEMMGKLLVNIPILGRMLHILPGKARPEDAQESEYMSFKQKKDAKQKATAGSSHNWNSLFLGANAVADVMAEKYKTTKSQILDASSRESLGVRMALGDTQIVAETRDFLLENGVSLDAFSQPGAQRSRSVLLVKNLPADTKAPALQEVFARYGAVSRVVLPPSGVTAIVEYQVPAEARSGFNNLAYTKFQNVPLYLEWAPMDVFKAPEDKEEEKEKVETTEKDTEKDTEKQDEEEKETKEEKKEEKGKEKVKEKEGSSSESEEEAELGSTLFVKNLSFDTRDNALKEHFCECGKLKSATVAKKKDMKNPGQMLSMGYGFVEYMKRESAQKALKLLQHSMLDGHQLELKTSNRATIHNAATKKKKQDPSKKQSSTKILIRNIPFEAKEKEIRELFATFGELKSVRLPKKLSGTGSHRGFAFVDFLTKHDSKRAFNAMCHSTHLFGRRLVLEWADSEESLDQLRKKTADHFHDDVPSKKFKKSNILDNLKGTDGH